MSSAPPASIRQYRGRMARSILLTFIPLCLLPLIIAGGALFIFERDLINSIPFSTRIIVILLVAAGLALAAAGMWLAARRLTEPLIGLATNLSLFVDGNWEQRAYSGRQDESGLLAGLFNQMANDLVNTYRLLNHHKAGVSAEKKGAFVQLAQAAASPGDVDDFLEEAIQLINKYFELDCAALYLLEPDQSQDEGTLVLRHKSSRAQFEDSPLAGRFAQPKVPCNTTTAAEWPVVKAALSRRSHTAPANASASAEAGTDVFEAAVPVILAGQVLGALNLFSSGTANSGRSRSADKRLGPFSIRTLSELQALASLIAMRLSPVQAESAASQTPSQAVESPSPVPEVRESFPPGAAARQLAELQTLWNISQAIGAASAIETDLAPLFETIHRQVEAVMGGLNSFAIALYDAETDTISVPYMYEEDKMVDIPPFPLGEGLSTIVVRTRSPLMLVEDTERKSSELGAKTVGQPAKSWLGVPMLFGGDVVGVIIAQDINREHRFDEEDQRLLSTLAAQVAIVVRNARLLESSRRQADIEHMVNEITAKIRRASDMQSILRTTADELGAALGVRRAHIRISPTGMEPDFGSPRGQEVEK